MHVIADVPHKHVRETLVGDDLPAGARPPTSRAVALANGRPWGRRGRSRAGALVQGYSDCRAGINAGKRDRVAHVVRPGRIEIRGSAGR